MSVLNEFWHDQPNSKKLSLVAGVLIILALAVGIWVWSTEKTYAVLYDELNNADAAAITKELQALKIDYQLAADGGAILVGEEVLHEARLRLADSGTRVDGNIGFELFDNVEYGMSDFSQKILLQRALQGEIARTIMALDEVKYARVHLVMAESGLFAKDKQNSKASVSLIPKNNVVLNPAQIKGIQVLVASSVRGLEPAQVLITGSHGMTLTRPGDDDINSARLDKKREVEDYLSAKAKQIMDEIYGFNVGVLNIDVALNDQRVERQTETMLNAGGKEGGVMLEKKETSKRTTQSNNNNDKSAVNQEPLTTTSEIKYAVGRAVEQFVHEPGGIKRITVSVLVPNPVDVEQLASLKVLISNAIGLDVSRGDVIAINGMDFANTAALATLAPQDDPLPVVEASLNKQPTMPETPLMTVLISVAVLLVLVLVALLFNRRTSTADKLSPQEREALLQQIQRWVNEEPGQVAAPSTETAS